MDLRRREGTRSSSFGIRPTGRKEPLAAGLTNSCVLTSTWKVWFGYNYKSKYTVRDCPGSSLMDGSNGRKLRPRPLHAIPSQVLTRTRCPASGKSRFNAVFRGPIAPFRLCAVNIIPNSYCRQELISLPGIYLPLGVSQSCPPAHTTTTDLQPQRGTSKLQPPTSSVSAAHPLLSSWPSQIPRAWQLK